VPPSSDPRAPWALLFWCWLGARTLAWTLVAALTQPNAPLDTVEWLAWGRQWQLGYPKHPPLTGWIGEMAFDVGGLPAVYLLGCLAVAVALWSAWCLARRLMPPHLALIAVLALDGSLFFTQRTGEFNNNLVLNGLWALGVLGFVRAVSGDRAWAWLGTGVALGLAFLAKYAAVMLAGAMLLTMLAEPGARRAWRRPGPYLAAAAGALVVLPHLVWLVRHDWPTGAYVAERAATGGGVATHFMEIGSFFGANLLRLTPAAVILGLLLTRSRPAPAADATVGQERRLLTWLVAIPLATLLLLALVGWNVRADYGSPLWTFAPACLLAWRTPAPSPAAWRRAIGGWLVVAVLSVATFTGLNLLSPSLRERTARIHFPGRPLAEAVERRWAARARGPLPIVAGNWWLAGNVSLYGTGRAAVFGSATFDGHVPDPRGVDWTNDHDLERRGAILLWDAGRWGDDVPLDLRRRYPAAEGLAPVSLPYHYARRLPPARVGLALIAPPP
jgi:4-amino-4-deoxy-L-arabinose transferase-like glycosyltransferase